MKHPKSAADRSRPTPSGTSRRRWIAGLICGPACATVARAASERNLQATLVHASNRSGDSDAALGSLLSVLQRMLPFSHYRRLGSARTMAPVPGQSILKLGHGSELTVDLEPVDGSQLRAGVRWTQRGRGVINTTVVLRPGTPAVLGGADYEDGKLVVALTVR